MGGAPADISEMGKVFDEDSNTGTGTGLKEARDAVLAQEESEEPETQDAEQDSSGITTDADGQLHLDLEA